MCGISGFISLTGNADISLQVLQQMNRAIAHRGPDAEGYFIDRGIGLGHRRLSIIDVSAGQQPMYSDDNNLVIVFNGEIYNFLDINKELEALGHKFTTHSDTETLLRAYQQWGVGMLDKLNGMFAFVLWDKSHKTAFIARDRIGEKPFYYSMLSGERLIFASELKALKAHPDFVRDYEPKAIEDFMTFGYVPEPKSLYKHTYKLRSGHYALLKIGQRAEQENGQMDAQTSGVSAQGLNSVQYWDLPWDKPSAAQPSSEQMITKLKHATDIRMMSEVPLGAFLSGGVDSSAIVAMMAQLQTEAVNTVAIGFDVPEVNESEFADLVAKRYHTNHHLEVVDHESFEIIDQLPHIYDEPFADSSAVPTYKVCEAARKGVTVCLSGDGGDELFVGYRRYKLHKQESKLRAILPLALRKAVFAPLAKIYPKADWAPKFLRAKTSFQSLAMSDWEAYLNSISKVRADEREQLFSSAFTASLNGYNAKEVFAEHVQGKTFSDPIKQAQYLDFKTWMPGDILTKVDRASMVHALEVRVPMLDHEFVEWAFSIDTAQSLQGSNGKANLKKALESHLPYENLYRNKMGFSIPLAKWLRGPLKERLLSSITQPYVQQLNIFDAAKVKQMYEQHLAGTHNHEDALWSIMTLSDVLAADHKDSTDTAEPSAMCAQQG